MNTKRWKGIPGKGVKHAEKVLDNEVLLANDMNYAEMTFSEYLDLFGEQKGIEEFYKNYKSLKIVDEWNGYQVKEPIKFSEVDEYKEEDY